MSCCENYRVKGQHVRQKITDIIRQGNVNRIKVKDRSGKVLINIPVSIAAIGSLLAPALAGIGVVASLMTECTIEVEKNEKD